LSANTRLNKKYQLQPRAVTIPTDPASLKAGEHLVSIYCMNCHGENLAGTDFFNNPSLAVVDASNLTAGIGGIGGEYSDLDWVRAIRHGADPQGKALFIMPAGDFHHFSDEDLGNIIAYLKSIPPVDRESNDFSITLIGRVLLAAGAFGNVLNVETIDHNGSRPDSPARGVTQEYGEYLVKTFGCRTCHGQGLSGGVGPEPGSPIAPNLTPGDNLQYWSGQDFVNNVRARRSEWMPFESLSKMTDSELQAIFMYLQSLPALEATTK
jgi:mono/diheme cytochrome c family protein